MVNDCVRLLASLFTFVREANENELCAMLDYFCILVQLQMVCDAAKEQPRC